MNRPTHAPKADTREHPCSALMCPEVGGYSDGAHHYCSVHVPPTFFALRDRDNAERRAAA